MNKKKFLKCSIGRYLRFSRKKIGLTKKNIANSLCLKLSIIQSIEDDTVHKYLEKPFVNGYIYSYARLVKISNCKLKFFLSKHKIHNTKSSSIKKQFIYNKNQKNFKYNILIIIIITIIVCLLKTKKFLN